MPASEKKIPLENIKKRLRALFAPGGGDAQKKKTALPPKAHFSIWYFLITFILLILLQQYLFYQKVETIPYSQFKQNLAAGTVTKLIISPENINGTIKGGGKKPDQTFVTLRVDDPNLVKELDEHKID